MSESSILLENDGTIVVTKTTDVSEILKTTKELHNSGYGNGKEMKYAGSYPKEVVEKYCTLNGITFSEFMQNQEHIRRLLNDKSLADFRIWKGRV